ncbi:MAG: hypothetical protein ACE5OT_01335 [Candidatus Hadarchaeaceae archaeon]
MRKMNFKEKILSMLEEQLMTEQEAATLYGSLAEKVGKPSIKKIFDFVKKEEIGHEKIVKETIESVKRLGEAGTVKESEISLNVGKALGEFSPTSNFLIITGADNYTQVLVNIIKQLIDRNDFKCVHVLVNRTSSHMKELLKRNNVETGKTKFITCAIGGVKKEKMFVDPKNLTNLSIEISGAMKNLNGKKFLLIDMLSNLLLYHNLQAIQSFVSQMNAKSEDEGFAVIYLSIKEEELKRVIGVMCDKVVEI